MTVLTIDLSSGKKTEQTVSGFNDWGEITRVFMYDGAKNMFYLLQANFTSSNPNEKVTLYSIDPVKAQTTAQVLDGPIGLVTGYAFDKTSGNIVMATYDYAGETKIGYSFYAVNPSTAVTKKVSSCTFNSTDNYAGWFKKVANNGTTVFRLGYQDVYQQTGPGIALTDLSTPNATTTWYDGTLAPGYDWFISLNLESSSSFLSLAPSTSGLSAGELSLFRWNLKYSNSTLVAKFGNAHQTPYFGPLVETMSGDGSLYAALVVHNGLTPSLDRWALAVVNLTTNSSKLIELDPRMIGEIDSASAFGIPNTQQLPPPFRNPFL